MTTFYVGGKGCFNAEVAARLKRAQADGKIRAGKVKIFGNEKDLVGFLCRCACRGLTSAPGDSYFIPSHYAPHILGIVFEKLISDGFKDFSVKMLDIKLKLDVPFFKRLGKGIYTLSLSDFKCPLDCTEPAVCPVTGRKRSKDIGYIIKSSFGRKVDLLSLFPCYSFAGSVGVIPLSLLAQEWTRMKRFLLTDWRHRIAVATHSHCHGIAAVFEVV